MRNQIWARKRGQSEIRQGWPSWVLDFSFSISRTRWLLRVWWQGGWHCGWPTSCLIYYIFWLPPTTHTDKIPAGAGQRPRCQHSVSCAPKSARLCISARLPGDSNISRPECVSLDCVTLALHIWAVLKKEKRSVVTKVHLHPQRVYHSYISQTWTEEQNRYVNWTPRGLNQHCGATLKA